MHPPSPRMAQLASARSACASDARSGTDPDDEVHVVQERRMSQALGAPPATVRASHATPRLRIAQHAPWRPWARVGLRRAPAHRDPTHPDPAPPACPAGAEARPTPLSRAPTAGCGPATAPARPPGPTRTRWAQSGAAAVDVAICAGGYSRAAHSPYSDRGRYLASPGRRLAIVATVLCPSGPDGPTSPSHERGGGS